MTPGSHRHPRHRRSAGANDLQPGSGLDLARAVSRSPEVFECHRRRIEWHLLLGHDEAAFAALLDAFRGLPSEARSDRAHLLRSCRRVIPREHLHSFDRWVGRGLTPTDPAPAVRGTVLPTGFGPEGTPAVRLAEAATAEDRRSPIRARAVKVGLGMLLVTLAGAALAATQPWRTPSADHATGSPAATARPPSTVDDEAVAATGVGSATLPSAPTLRHGAPRPTSLPAPDDAASTANAIAARFAEQWAWLLANPDPELLDGFVARGVGTHEDLGALLSRLRDAGRHIEIDHIAATGRTTGPVTGDAQLLVDIEMGGVVTVDSDTAAVVVRGPSQVITVPMVLELRAEGDSWSITSARVADLP